VVRQIDAAISAFLRGRILICAAVGVLTAAGLAIVGVPYWYLIGVATGLAGVVPFMPIFVGLIPAVLVAWPFMPIFVGLHPVTLTVALLVGYKVLGLFGLIAAVPLASTVKILAREFVLPKVEELADETPDAGA